MTTTNITKDMLTHSAIKWVFEKSHCDFIIRDIDGAQSGKETPCFLALNWAGQSIQVVSILSKDDLKEHAQYISSEPEFNNVQLGMFRLYVAPKDLISTEGLTPRWGLLEYESETQPLIETLAPHFDATPNTPESKLTKSLLNEANRKGEWQILFSKLKNASGTNSNLISKESYA